MRKAFATTVIPISTICAKIILNSPTTTSTSLSFIKFLSDVEFRETEQILNRRKHFHDFDRISLAERINSTPLTFYAVTNPILKRNKRERERR